MKTMFDELDTFSDDELDEHYTFIDEDTFNDDPCGFENDEKEMSEQMEMLMENDDEYWISGSKSSYPAFVSTRALWRLRVEFFQKIDRDSFYKRRSLDIVEGVDLLRTKQQNIRFKYVIQELIAEAMHPRRMMKLMQQFDNIEDFFKNV